MTQMSLTKLLPTPMSGTNKELTMSELTELLNQRQIKRMVLTQTTKVLVVLKKDNSYTKLPNEELPSLTMRLMENGEMLAISLEDNYAVMGDEDYTYYLTLKKDTVDELMEKCNENKPN